MKIMKRHLLWIVEVFIWLLILFLVSGGLMLAKYNYKKSFNTYQIFLPDVDGLINGSPVRLMGIQIGYVNQIDIVGEDVYVRFRVTEKKVKIPAGSIATVEFSGLGGSKSLEIYPPKPGVNFGGKFLTPQSPKRIHDSLGLLNDMFDKVIEIAFKSSHFIDQLNEIKCDKISNEKTHPQTAEQFLNRADNFLDKAQKHCDKIGIKLKKKDGKNERTYVKNNQ